MYSGLEQTFPVHGDHHYQCSAYIKVYFNTQGKLFANLHMFVTYKTTDGKFSILSVLLCKQTF